MNDVFEPELNGEGEGTTFLDLGNLEEVPELTTLPDGSEAELVISTIEVRVSKNTGGKFIYVIFDIVGEPNTKSITHVMMLPTDKDDDKRKNQRLRAIRHFYEAFGIPTSGSVDLSSFVGNTGWAILREEADEEYGTQNRIRRFIV